MPGPKIDETALEYKGHHINLTLGQSKNPVLLMEYIREVAIQAVNHFTTEAKDRAPWRSWLFDIQSCVDYIWNQVDPQMHSPRELARMVNARDKDIAELRAQLERSRTAVALWNEMQVPVHLEYKAREAELENAKAYIARLEGIQAELTEVDKAREAELKEARARAVELEQEVETVQAEQANAERRLDAAYAEMEECAVDYLHTVQRIRASRKRAPEPLDARIAKALGYNLGHIRTRSLEQVRATLKVNAEAHTSRTYIDLIAEVDELNRRNVPGPWWAAR